MSAADVPLESAARSERGVRPTNEDAVLCRGLPDGRWLAAVADGMGGLQEGEAASRTALGALETRLEAGDGLARAFEEANRLVFRRSRDRATGTTLVAALVEGALLRIANVGDSRAYLLGPEGLVQVTRDHTYAAEAAAHGDATAREVTASRWGRTLTRFVGAAETVEVDLFGPMVLPEGVRVLLSSDGVHGVLDDAAIRSCVDGTESPERSVDLLLTRSLERGGRDNLSAVILQRGTHPARAPAAGTDPGEVGVSKADAREAPEGPPEPARDRAGSESGGDADAAFELPPVRGADPTNDEARFELPRVGEAEAAARGSRDPRDPGPAEKWDPAHLARRAPRSRKRKPGRAAAVILVVALAVLVLLMTVLLP